MGLRFDPVGGGQFKQFVNEVIQAERQPIKNLEARKGMEDKKLKLFGDFKNKVGVLKKTVEEFTSFQKFRELKVDLGSGKELAEVTIDKEKAYPGSYEIEINSLARRSSMISNGFENPEEPALGLGYVIVYGPDGEPFELFVDESESSLYNVAAMINRSPNSPIQASVIKDVYEPDKPWKLLLSSKLDGENRAVEFPEFYFLDGARNFWTADDHSAQNAILKVEGYEIDAESNEIVDFIQGVNFKMKEARPDRPFQMTISVDYEKIAGKVKALVDQTNEVLDFINKQNTVDDKTDTTTTFTGDTGLQTIEYRLRNLLHEGFPVGDVNDDKFRLVWLNGIGVEFTKNGQLKFNADKFNTVIEKDFAGVADAMTGEYGFARQLNELLNLYTRPGDGLLAMRERGLRDRIKQIDTNIDAKERLLEKRAQALTEKFSRLQGSLSNLQKQQQYLTATLGSVGSNPIAQLLGG